MKATWKLMLSLVITMLIGLGIGIYTEKYIYQPKSVDFEDETKKIDSLENTIVDIETEKVIVHDSIIKVKIEKVKELERIERLPLDSGIIFLQIKLREYEENN